MKLFSLAFRQLRNTKKFTFLFVFNLTLGLVGLIALDAFKFGLSDYLSFRSKEILTADLSATSRTPLPDEDLNALRASLLPIARESSGYELYTMAKGPERSRLLELKVIDQLYPFYGEILLMERGPQTSQNHGDLHKEEEIWVYPEVLTQMGIEVGDKLKIGDIEFVVRDIVVKDSADVGVGGSFAPRAYISKEQFKKTNLLQKGSTARHVYLYELNQPTPEKVDSLLESLHDIVKDPGIRLNSYKTASEQTGRLLKYLVDYLGLVALIGLSFAAVGIVYLFRSFIISQSKTIAIYRCLGLSRGEVNLVYVFQVGLLGVMSSIPAILMALFFLPLLSSWAGSFINLPVLFELAPSTGILAFVISALGSVAICWPHVDQSTRKSPNTLFQGEQGDVSTVSLKMWGYYAGIVFLYWLLSVFLSRSWLNGSLFIGLLALSALILYFLGKYLFLSLAKWNWQKFAARYMARDLSRRPREVTLSFVTLALGALLLNIVPQIERNLLQEISTPSGAKLPSYFLFDIQDDQVDIFTEFVATEKVEMLNLSPMVRARLQEVNGEPFEKGQASKETFTREEQREMRFRNRGFNLSYRTELVAGEKVKDGKFYDEPYSDGIAAVSLETRFADRLDLEIGDKLVFDVQGVPIEGNVTSIRTIKWTTFLPNFFILFQEGVINEAPKTYLSALSSINDEEGFQNRLVELLPNVSLIDVSRLIQRITDIVANMKWMILLMAGLSSLVGFFVVGTMAYYQAQAQRGTANLLKVLGASFEKIRSIFSMQFLFLGLFAGLAGTTISSLVTFVFSKFLFEVAWSFNFPLAVGLTTGFTVATWGLGYLVIGRVLNLSPSEVFSERS